MCINLKFIYRRKRDGYYTFTVDNRYRDNYDVVQIPCGHCIECIKSYSTEWAFRCLLESKCYEQNCCITLTYADNCIDCVSKRDVQLFLKRLRESISPLTVRYFLCGEYGGLHNRPHYHILLFGYDFSDKYVWKRSKSGDILFRSPRLEKLWNFGFSTVQELNFGSCFYASKYLQKLDPRPHYEPPFTLMSRRPGIGYNAIKGDMLVTDKIYVDGKMYRIPRYFLRVFERDYGVDLTSLKKKRIQNSTLSWDSLEQKKIRKENLKKSLTFVEKPCYNDDTII